MRAMMVKTHFLIALAAPGVFVSRKYIYIERTYGYEGIRIRAKCHKSHTYTRVCVDWWRSDRRTYEEHARARLTMHMETHVKCCLEPALRYLSVGRRFTPDIRMYTGVRVCVCWWVFVAYI